MTLNEELLTAVLSTKGFSAVSMRLVMVIDQDATIDMGILVSEVQRQPDRMYLVLTGPLRGEAYFQGESEETGMANRDYRIRLVVIKKESILEVGSE